MMNENEANIKAYKGFLIKDLCIDIGVMILVCIAILKTGRLYPLWIVLLLSTRSFYNFTHKEEKITK